MIIKIFEEQVEKYKNKVAVKAGSEILTYDCLNRQANRAASHIASSVEVGTAALLFRYGVNMISGIIAALKAGLIYVPLDRNYPENRLVYILEDSGAGIILTDKANYSLATRITAKINRPIIIFVIDDIPTGYTGENIPRTAAGEKTAYILYTSGSTGKPKGVGQNHENVLYYTRNWTQRFTITSADRMTLLTAFTHDGFVQDFWSALHNGAALYPYDVKGTFPGNSLPGFIKKEQITIWHSVHTLFRYFAGGLSAEDHFPALRYILLGGEPLRKNDVELFKNYFPNAVLANVYGQTESSVVSIAVYTAGDTFTVPLLGKPLDKTQVLLVTGEGEIVEDVGDGEIVISCDHIALGYW
ncbi:MAG: AMP-binding protein, partial [Acidobacteria bacterium]|nr:AMP-binding protein [Acidobacteriota bacterium]